jgi:hypothetical protein
MGYKMRLEEVYTPQILERVPVQKFNKDLNDWSTYDWVRWNEILKRTIYNGKNDKRRSLEDNFRKTLGEI